MSDDSFYRYIADYINSELNVADVLYSDKNDNSNRAVSEIIMKDFLSVNKRMIEESRLVDNLADYYRIISDLTFHKTATIPINSMLREWVLNRVTAADLTTLDWISDQWYQVDSNIKNIDKCKVRIPSDISYCHAELSRVLIEQSILNGRNYSIDGIPELYSSAIDKAYDNNGSKYLISNLLKILRKDYVRDNSTVQVDSILSSMVQTNTLNIDITSTGTRTIDYTVYADRSERSTDYSISITVDIPFENEQYCYMVKHEPHHRRHIQEAALICAVSRKSTVLINSYDGKLYTIRNRMTESDIESFDRLLRINLHLNKGTVPTSLSLPNGLIMVVDTEHNGDDVYEYAAVVYDCSKRTVIDTIVLTNSKARVNTESVIDVPDGPDCHRFIVDNVGEDTVMTDRYKQFITKYKNSVLLHYGGSEGTDPLYEGMTKVDILRLYSKVHNCSYNRQRFVFYRSYPSIKSILFHRAFDDCISTLMIGLKLPLAQ